MGPELNMKLQIIHTRREQDTSINCIPLASKSIGQRGYWYLAPKLFNFLPKEIADETSLIRFKRQLISFLKKNDRMDIHKLIEA